MKIADNGTDFENFVFECFRYANEERGLVRRLAKGRDGAIDLFDSQADAASVSIVECKFIGSGAAADAAGRWLEVFKNLKSHLPGLAGDPAFRPRSPYRGWLIPSQPVASYRFCVTVGMTRSEESELAARIRSDLKSLVDAGVEQLRPLVETDGAIAIRSWDWFSTELDEHPSLRFRWFRGLPVGVRLFDRNPGSGTTFRSFISGDGLVYFSRDKFAAACQRNIRWPESRLVDAIAGDALPALLITGAGGVGKTRLCFELASSLSGEDRGFDAYWLEQNADFDSVVDIAGAYPGDANILLLIDYAEAASYLNKIADAIVHLTDNTGHRIRLIVTCRSSATNRVHDALLELHCERKSLDSKADGEQDYVRWVTQSILGLETFPDIQGLSRVCNDTPALAAFALYLFRQEPKLFDEQFGRLLGIGDFQRWADRRIRSLTARLGQTSPIDRMLAEIALSLPCDAADWVPGDAVVTSLKDVLLADRWIELDEGSYLAAHDVFADALLLRWVFEVEHASTDRIADLLLQTAQRGALSQGLAVIARLISHPRFRDIDGTKIVAALLQAFPEEVVASSGAILGGPLLDLNGKLSLLATVPTVAEEVCWNTELHPILGLLALEASKEGRTDHALADAAKLGELLDNAYGQQQRSNMLLRRAYAFDPRRFRERAFQNVALFLSSEQTHFLIVQMLKSGESPAGMSDLVRGWLEENWDSPKASFVFPAWLKAGGAPETISQYLYDWIDKHGQMREASHVYSAWTAAGGDFEAISVPLHNWIRVNREDISAAHGFSTWFRAGGSVDVIAEGAQAWLQTYGDTSDAHLVFRWWLESDWDIGAAEETLTRWIARHGGSPEANGVYQSWIKAGGNKDLISRPLKEWLVSHAVSGEARFLYIVWLNHGGSLDFVADELRKWLEVHGRDHEAVNLFALWVTNRGDPAIVERGMREWLERYGTMPEARYLFISWLHAGLSEIDFLPSFMLWIGIHRLHPEARHVYASWLDAGRQLEVIEEELLAWVGVHGESEGAEVVYRAWLDSQKKFGLLEAEIVNWVSIWGATQRFAYLSKAISRIKNIPESMILTIIRWSAAFPDHEDCLYRLSAALFRCVPTTASATSVVEMTGLVGRVIARRSTTGPMCAAQLWSICSALGRPPFYNKNPFGISRVFSEIVTSGRVFIEENAQRPFEGLIYAYDRIKQMLIYALRNRNLDIELDRQALVSFAKWLRASCDDKREVRRLLDALDDEFPSAIWSNA